MNATIDHALAERAAQITADLATLTPYDWHGSRRHHYDDIAERLTNDEGTVAGFHALIAALDMLGDESVGREFKALVRRCIRAQAAADLETDEHAPRTEEERGEDERDRAWERRAESVCEDL